MMRFPPPLLMVAAGVAQRALPRRGATPLRTVAAVGMAAVSTGMAGAASSAFRRRGTTVLPFEPARASVLVTSGANAVSRNPMYVGMAGLLLAHATHRGSWAALVPAAAFIAVIDVYQVRFEEVALHERFGEEYDAYRAAVPRWLDARSPSAITAWRTA